MAQKKGIYNCNVCGNIIEILDSGAGELVCCGQPMELITEKGISNEGNEKHVPVIEKKENEIIIKIGSTPHPMEENHFIEWIELVADGVSYKRFLNQGDDPLARFCLNANEISARCYCNVHRLWKS